MVNGWVLAIIAIASLIKGITGFGFSLIALPLLLFWHSPHELIPVLTVCNLIVSVIIVLQKKERKLVDKSYRQMIVIGSLFAILGVALLKHLPESILASSLAIAFIIMSLISLFGLKFPFNINKYTHWGIGALCGFMSGSTSVYGPPLALYLNHAGVDNRQFREIFSWFSITIATMAIVGYGFVGLLSMATLNLTLVFLPILYLGSFIGKRINQHLPTTVFKHINTFISLASSILLLTK